MFLLFLLRVLFSLFFLLFVCLLFLFLYYQCPLLRFWRKREEERRDFCEVLLLLFLNLFYGCVSLIPVFCMLFRCSFAFSAEEGTRGDIKLLPSLPSCSLLPPPLFVFLCFLFFEGEEQWTRADFFSSSCFPFLPLYLFIVFVYSFMLVFVCVSVYSVVLLLLLLLFIIILLTEASCHSSY